MTTRRTITVAGRQGIRVTMVAEVYRGKVWLVAVEPGITSEAILHPAEADRLIEMLRQAAGEARDDR